MAQIEPKPLFYCFRAGTQGDDCCGIHCQSLYPGKSWRNEGKPSISIINTVGYFATNWGSILLSFSIANKDMVRLLLKRAIGD